MLLESCSAGDHPLHPAGSPRLWGKLQPAWRICGAVDQRGVGDMPGMQPILSFQSPCIFCLLKTKVLAPAGCHSLVLPSLAAIKVPSYVL